MKNSNIIISVIIVLCIAAGVTAYSITNPENNIFSLPGYTPSDDADGDLNGDGLNRDIINGDGENSGNSGSHSNGGSGSGSGSGSGTHIGMTSSQAKQIITAAIGEKGSYAGTPRWDSSNQMWVAKIYDKDGNIVDSIGVDSDKRTNRV